ncbi:MAG: hypothetical protein H6684_12320 [Deltaproteobacteria bacterium]|nr:hypothetical protein [Deltaproteobacteria bacterium]
MNFDYLRHTRSNTDEEINALPTWLVLLMFVFCPPAGLVGIWLQPRGFFAKTPRVRGWATFIFIVAVTLFYMFTPYK